MIFSGSNFVTKMFSGLRPGKLLLSSSSGAGYKFVDDKFMWLKSIENVNDNYWYGDVEYYNGAEAMDIAGLTDHQNSCYNSEKPTFAVLNHIHIIEWIHFHPLKKLLIFGLWGFGVVLVLRGIWVTATGKIEMDGELFLFLLGTAVLVVALFQKMKRYICTPYRNIPALNQILSKNQLEQLLDGEHFEP